MLKRINKIEVGMEVTGFKRITPGKYKMVIYGKTLLLLMCTFVIAQLIAMLISVYAHWEFSFVSIEGIGWGWAGVIWIYNVVFYVPLDIINFVVCYTLNRQASELMFERKTIFRSKKDYGRDNREAKWALSQRSLHGLIDPDVYVFFEHSSMIIEQARRRA